MKVVLSHPTGNENVRAVAMGLLKEEMLSHFYTSVATFPGVVMNKLCSFDFLRDLKRRQFDTKLKPFTSTFPVRELGRIAALKSNLKSLTFNESGIFSIDSISQYLDKKIASKLRKLSVQGVTAVYGYEDGASSSFARAKEIGMQCYYDLPIGYWRAARHFLQGEQERWPDWRSTFTAFTDSPSKLSRKDSELQFADRIFVASSFTAKTLEFYPGKLSPVDVIPYGFPPVVQERNYFNVKNRSLRILFVGGLSQRKGIADLFAAVEPFAKYIHLTIVGQKITKNCPALELALNKHKWIPSLPHDEVLKLMQQNDVLVFPSLFEGFGLVISEAMSQGTPVLTTERTAGPDLINHGDNGWLVPAGSTQALREALEMLIQKPIQIVNAGRNAIETARNRPWEVYGKELSLAIRNEK